MFEQNTPDWSSIDASSDAEYKKPCAGGYVVRIVDAEDDNEHEKLVVTFDIADGEFAGYYMNDEYRAARPYMHQFYVSYKEKAMGLFKHFFECVEQSNNWKWDGHNEKAFVGKVMGIVLAEEEYIGNDGAVKTRFSRLVDYKTIDQIRNGEFKVKETKRIAQDTSNNQVVVDDFSDVPF